jgi:hypothetical protein
VAEGYSEKEAETEISKIQTANAKLVKIRHGHSKDNLKKNGYSDEEIRRITLAPSMVGFWINKGYSEEDAIIQISEMQRLHANAYVTKRNNNPDIYSASSSTQLAYWVNLGYPEEEAKLKLKERQQTFTLEKCIAKYGEVDGIERFTERQRKWTDSLNKNGNLKIGHSKVSQELFYKLLEAYEINDRENVFFATHNKEFRLDKDDGGVWMYDFTDIKNKKIIEFNGDIFHGNPSKYNENDSPNPFNETILASDMWEKDKRKYEQAIKNGFETLIVWDSEYRYGDKEDIVKKCLEFLKK